MQLKQQVSDMEGAGSDETEELKFNCAVKSFAYTNSVNIV
jgi:hypothetical protein